MSDEVLDVSATLAAKSDQLNADDLIGGPMTGTITNATKGATAEQPVNLQLDSWKQPWKPCKTMRRLLAHFWGSDAKKWIGKRITLYREAEVRFGGETVGGIRVSHLSGLEKPETLALTISRAKKQRFTVQPIAAESSLKPDKLWKRLVEICGSEGIAKQTLQEQFGVTSFKGLAAEKAKEIENYCDQQQGGE